jgi:Bacterial Ig domain
MKKLFPLLVCFFSSCGKPDEIAPVITVDSPTQNQSFAVGQTITIKANVTDNEGIHMVHVIVIDNSGGHWVHSEDHPDSKSFAINKTFMPAAGKIYTIHIDANDHNENTATSELTVSAN